jgi:hypothetical protein
VFPFSTWLEYINIGSGVNNEAIDTVSKTQSNLGMAKYINSLQIRLLVRGIPKILSLKKIKTVTNSDGASSLSIESCKE